MKKFVIKVNGVAYDVEVEENNAGGKSSVPAAAPKAAAPAQSEKKEEKPQSGKKEEKPQPKPAAPAGSAGSEAITAPMAGTVMSVEVSVGDSVVKGQTLLVFEAMKMENEIVSPRDGEIASVNAAKGASVNSGDTLISLV